MKCPKCESDDCQRLEVIYESGTQHINTTSRTVGGGATGSGAGGGAAHTTTSGTSRSTLANKAAPPSKKSIGFYVIMIIIGIFMLVGGWMLKLLGLGLIGLGVYLTNQALSYNKNEFPEKYEYWLNEWMCNRCGNIFHLKL